jgi:hypothetical protein
MTVLGMPASLQYCSISSVEAPSKIGVAKRTPNFSPVHPKMFHKSDQGSYEKVHPMDSIQYQPVFHLPRMAYLPARTILATIPLLP